MTSGESTVPGEDAQALVPERDDGHVRVFKAETVFAKAQEVIIEYAGQSYHLRITRNGKLILTK